MTSAAYQLKRDWVLDREAFDRLLGLLDSDPAAAGNKYERIKLKVTKLFQWRGCPEPEEYAAKTIEGAARELLEGTPAHFQNPYIYFHDVAINVARVLEENWRETNKELDGSGRGRQDSDARESGAGAEDKPGEAEAQPEKRLECLKACVSALPPESLELIAKYHNPEGLSVEGRKELARSLGIPQNALRIQAFKIRVRLESDVTSRLSQSKSARAVLARLTTKE